jgi:hypothetical protein
MTTNERKLASVYHRDTHNRITRRKLTQAQIDAYRAEGHNVMVPGEDGVQTVAIRSAHEFTGRFTPMHRAR